ncbi:MAG: O-antigen ligase family protein [Planctomycetaceae bacterium]|nr:O-antigen ligase family protein [Planctomycetaceae bacterium]
MSRPAQQSPPSAQGIPWLMVAALMLIAGRLYLPAEASEQGLTLPFAALGFLLLAFHCWWSWRNEEPIQFSRPSLATWGLILLIAGHVLSGLDVLATGGNRRTALNLLWEWLSVGAVVILLKSYVRQHATMLRQLFVYGLVASVVTLSTYGMWQCTVWYPKLRAEANQLFLLDSRRTELSPAERRELAALEKSIAGYTDKDQTGKLLLLARLRGTEPIGKFALANTFAGLLIVGLLILGSAAWQQRGNRIALLQSLIPLLMVAACFWFSDSRTAQVGLLFGAVISAALLLKQRQASGGESDPMQSFWSRHALSVAAAILFLLLLSGVVVAATRPDLLTGPLLSLKYRGEYWRATLNMMSDHPIRGIGLGNFRPRYLQYKLVGSSEEILDPHNLVLDAWANGGLLALVGLGIMLWQGFRSFSVSLPGDHQQSERLSLPARMGLALLPVALVLFIQMFLEGTTDSSLFWLLIPAGLFAAFVPSSLLEARSLGSVAAWLALTVHLCGAGGIGMPAMTQLWIGLWLLLPTTPTSTAAVESAPSRQDAFWLGGAVGSAVLVLACLWTGVIPATTTRNLLDAASALQNAGQMRQAESLLESAVDADALSPDTWQALSLHNMGAWRQSPAYREEEFERAIETQEEAIKRDPFAGKRFQMLGEWWAMKFKRSQKMDDAQAAIAAYEQAANLYPNFAPIHAELADVLARNGHNAKDAAQRAIELDDANKAANHFDKVLPDAQRERLEQILSE